MGQCVQGQMPAADQNFSQIKKIAAALATLCASWQGVRRATPRLNREVTVAEQTEGEKPQFKTPMPRTPTTKILAVGTFAPGTDMSQVQRILSRF